MALRHAGILGQTVVGKRREVAHLRDLGLATDHVEVRGEQAADVEPLHSSPEVATSVEEGVVEVEAVDQERDACHEGKRKIPPGRNPEGAVRLESQNGGEPPAAPSRRWWILPKDRPGVTVTRGVLRGDESVRRRLRPSRAGARGTVRPAVLAQAGFMPAMADRLDQA